MKPCARCRRHVRRAASACPFCAAPLSEQPAPAPATAWALGLVMLAACGGDKSDATSESSGTDTGADTSTGSTTTATTGLPTTSGDAGTGTDTDTDTGCGTACNDSTEAGGFIYGAPDFGSSTDECDVLAEDCPAGQKCMPWIEGDPSGGWNALKCVPVDPDPAQHGEPCVAPGGGGDGVDDCDKHVMCWDVTAGMGTCVAMCEDSQCPTGSACFVANEGVLNLCLPVCDPDMPDCPEGEICIPVPTGGVCANGG